jgi:hypothetical protein
MPRRKTLFQRRDVAPRTFIGTDDSRASIIRRDLTGGMNTRQHANVIAQNEAKNIRNIDLVIPGERRRRPGRTLIEEFSTSFITGMFGYEPQGAQANLLTTDGTYLRRWTGSGSFSNVKTDFTTGLITKMIKAYKTGTGDVALISNGTDNVFQMAPGTYTMTNLGDTNTSPPKTIVMEPYRNRVWALKSDLLYFSDASPSNYATGFDRTTNYFRIPVGEERALVGTRDLGLLVVGKDQVWGLNPSDVPVATDKPEKISEYGCVAGETFKQVGDDYLYLAFDGVRGIKRTVQDKLQYGQTLPLSYKLKTEFESISWNYIHKACSIYWDNKYFIALPVNGSTYNNQVWVYYPATSGWMVIDGWNVGAWAKFKVSGEERLYFGISHGDSLILYDENGNAVTDDDGFITYVDDSLGKVFRGWYGATDNGNPIHFIEESRNEDLGFPLIKKYAGELKVVAKPIGDYNVSVYGSFDNGSYNLLGYLDVSTNVITFPTSFPIIFGTDALAYKKFPLDSYGEWYTFRHKIEHNEVTDNSDDITIYETSLTAIPQEYDPEEEI